MRINAPSWQGAQTAIPMHYAAANDDARAGLALRQSAWEHEQGQRDAINALLRRKAEIEAQKKAERKARRKKNLATGLAIGGTVLGAGAGALLAPAAIASAGAGSGFAAGTALTAAGTPWATGAIGGAALGAGVGGSLGSAIGQGVTTGDYSAMGSAFTNFAEEFLPTNPNPYYQMVQQMGGVYPPQWGATYGR